MATFSVLALISCFSFAFAQKCACGTERTSSRIIGGTEVPHATYPWMAFIEVNTTAEGDFGCGGAIINDRYILTVAHCFDDVVKVRYGVGSIYDNTQSEMLPIESFVQHPDYKRIDGRNDIALIKVLTPFKWSRSIRPICLPTPNMNTSGNLTVAGWGIKDMETEEYSHTLLETVVEEYDFDDCKKRWSFINSTTQFCAAVIGRDSCRGDSGGPLWKRFRGRSYTVGIVSFGVQDCATERAAVYTKVTQFLDWIRENTADANYCSK